MSEEDAFHDPAREIGRVLKRVRFERDLTLDNVSELTGVSKTMLGQIERGVSVPTVSVLWKIARGMRISLSSLFNEEIPAYKAVAIEKDLQPVFDEDGQMVLYNVVPFNPVNGFEYFYIILHPGALHSSEPHRDDVTEYLVVTQGTLLLTVGMQSFALAAPAKLSFRANIRHSYANEGDTDVIFQNIMKY